MFQLFNIIMENNRFHYKLWKNDSDTTRVYIRHAHTGKQKMYTLTPQVQDSVM